jgi:glutaryl-CoA dehydrogenase
MRTFAYKNNGDWVITGEKMWITNAAIADISVIWAKTDDGIKGFIVEMDKQGIEIVKMKSNISLRAFITAGIKLNEVVVSDRARLPEAYSLKAPLTCLTEKRYGMAWGAIGAAIDCFLQSLEYAKERIMFGRPVVSSQLIQRKLVNMLVEITKAKSISIQVGRIKEKEKYFRHEMVALVALNNLTKSVEIARDAKEIQGVNGISLESRVIRHLLNLESLNAYEGVNDIYLLIIGRDITGMQAFF